MKIQPNEITTLHKATNQIINDLCDLFHEEELVHMEKIERIVFDNMAKSFPQKRAAELLGVSVKTLRRNSNIRFFVVPTFDVNRFGEPV